MDDGAVRPGARDGVEAGVAKVAAGAAELEQLVAQPEFVEPALRAPRPTASAGSGPARPRRAPARRVAGDLGLVLDRLGEDGGVALLHHLRAALSSASKIAATARSGSATTVLPQASEDRLEGVAVVDAHAVAEMLADIVADLLRAREQVRRAVLVHQREGEATGVCSTSARAR
jgi:hypothetical protein